MFLRKAMQLLTVTLLAVGAKPLVAQELVTVRGTVTRALDKLPLAGAQVHLVGTSYVTTTNSSGRFVMTRVAAGAQTFAFRALGYAPQEKQVTASSSTTIDVALEARATMLAEVSVTSVSREPERIVEAPAAVTSIEPRVLQMTGATGQAPLALAQAPGVDLAQSGVNDFNVNARGFNSSLNRRVLTMLDGRDLAIAFLGSQEWYSLPASTEGFKSMELVRGPGSALYGANAFAGVINMVTWSPREAPGGRFSMAGGELSSFKADGSYANTFGEGRWGLRVTGGYSTNDTWTRSRTSIDSLDMQREYTDAVKAADDFLVKKEIEALPLNGQTLGVGRAATGDRKPIVNMFGTVRVDNYAMGPGVLTLEGGASQSENEVLVSGIGRVQVTKAFKPFARAAYTADRFTVFGYWNNRDSKDPQYSLTSGAPLVEHSNIFHIEAQGNFDLLGDRGRLVLGASERMYKVDTDGTLMRPEDDVRDDKVHSVYGQMEYRFNDKVRLVGAGRYDQGDLFEGQFSPKAALVFSPNPNHSFRATFNKAFQTPNYSEFFLRVNARANQNFALLEGALRASALGPALAGVPNGTLFTTSNSVPVYARGNAALKVEETKGYEIGYRGSPTTRTWVTVDAYFNNITNFVTDLLPGVNPTFAYWTAPDAVPAPYRAALVSAVQTNLAPSSPLAAAGLTRTEDGNTAVVVSYTNAGDVDQRGVDVGAGIQLNNAIRLDGSISFFKFTVNEQQAGDQLLPNTPKRKGVLNLSYDKQSNGLDASVSVRMVEAYDWAAGVYVGRVPSQETVTASLGYQLSNTYRFSVTGTNLLDQQRYSLYGGSVNGRRLIGGVTLYF